LVGRLFSAVRKILLDPTRYGNEAAYTSIEGHSYSVWNSATFDNGQQCSLWS